MGSDNAWLADGRFLTYVFTETVRRTDAGFELLLGAFRNLLRPFLRPLGRPPTAHPIANPVAKLLAAHFHGKSARAAISRQTAR